MTTPTLILSPRHTDSSQVLWRTAVEKDWNIERFHGWKIPEDFKPEGPIIYGEPLFNQVVADHLGLTLPEPPEDFLCRVEVVIKNSGGYLQNLPSYKTHQHAVNDFARDALNRHPDAFWIELQWSHDTMPQYQWCKRKDGWRVMSQVNAKEELDHTSWRPAEFLNTA